MNHMKTPPTFSGIRAELPRQATRRRGGFRAKLSGFTLVEVTLALGVISFAFVAMFGLLPVGLNVSRQAIDTTVTAQIMQQLKTQALQTDFSMLDALASAEPYYFDDQGKTVSPEVALYKAVYEVSTQTALSDSLTSDRLATVTIYVQNTNGSPSVTALDPTASPGAKKFALLIPDNGL